MRQIRDIVLKKEEMWVENKKRKERLELIEKRGLEPGVEVCSSNGKRGFISKIDKNGYVVLKGARGAFNPIGIEHV